MDAGVAQPIMSGISGLFLRNGCPAPGDIVARMQRTASHYAAAAAARCWSAGCVALGHQPLAGREPGAKPGMLDDPAVDMAITFDGRLDNRGEIIAALEKPCAPGETSDAALALQAYVEWGDASAARLLGDFAFAVWDGRTRTVFCARDVFGVKPFYYHLTDRSFTWASGVAQLLASGVAAREPNEGMVAEYLAASIRSREETLYRGIMRLPPAHTLTVSRDSVRLRRYWQLDPAADVTCRDDAAYAERLWELLRAAVECRLRGGPLGFFLSGGLDSSSVVATAAALGQPVAAFSMVFPGQHGIDESGYIHDVAAASGATAYTIVAPRVQPGATRRNIVRRGDIADLPCDGIGESVLARMRERGVRVALTGHGGDHAFGGTVYHYADFLREGRYLAFLRQAWADARTPGNGWSAWDPLLCGVRPLLPQPLRTAVRPLARRAGLVPAGPDWIDARLAARVALADRLRGAVHAHDTSSFGRQTACDNYAEGWLPLINEMTDRRAAEYGIEERHPFLDRRVVEFAVGLPENQRWQGQESKYVLRRALGSLLPESVRTRIDKADFSPAVAQAFGALGGTARMRGLRIAELGWVSQPRVDALGDRMQHLYDAGNTDYADGMLKLWMIACVEAWYASAFAKGQGDDEAEHAESGGRRAAHGAAGAPGEARLSPA